MHAARRSIHVSGARRLEAIPQVSIGDLSASTEGPGGEDPTEPIRPPALDPGARSRLKELLESPGVRLIPPELRRLVLRWFLFRNTDAVFLDQILELLDGPRFRRFDAESQRQTIELFVTTDERGRAILLALTERHLRGRSVLLGSATGGRTLLDRLYANFSFEADAPLTLPQVVSST